MKKALLAFVVFLFGIPLVAAGVQISVPSAPGANYVLLSTSTGNYTAVATSSLGITAGSGGAWPWTIGTNFGVSVNSTTTPTWYKTGVFASSTSQFVNASTTLLSVKTIYGAIAAGDGTLNLNADGDGYYVNITASDGVTAGSTGGGINLQGGAASTSAFGGSINIIAGNGSSNTSNGTGGGGDLLFYAGDGGKSGNTNGGDISFFPGAANASGGAGHIEFFKTNTALQGVSVDLSALSDIRTLTFNDWSGTLNLATSSFMTGFFVATSTTASQLPFASTTALSATTFCLIGDTCRTTWPTGTGTVSTSSVPVLGQLAYWTTTTQTPAKLSTIGTTSIAFSGPFSGASSLGALVGGSNSTVTWTGFASTSQPSSSNLLVSNGAAGVYGVATGTVSAGSSAITVTAGRAAIGGALVIDCTVAATAQAGCMASADWNLLHTWLWTIATNFGTSTNSTTTPTWYKTGLYASSTSKFDQASSTLFSAGNPATSFFVGSGGTITSLGGSAISISAAFLQMSNSGGDVWLQNNNSSANSAIAIKAGSKTNDSGSAIKLEAGGFERMRITGNGGVGIGTTTPWATFSIAGSSTQSVTGVPLMTISSSTATATSTVFLIDANGLVTIPSIKSLSCIGTDSNGLLGSGTCSGGGAWPWTIGTNFGVAVNSTSTPTSYTTGVFASSTSQFVNANIWATLVLKATTSAVLSTDVSGNVIATTSIGSNYITGALGTVNTNFPLSGGGTLSRGGTLTLAYGGIGTSSAPVVGNLAYWTAAASLGTVATTAVACSGFISCTGFSALGAASTITTTGQLAVASGGTNASSLGSHMLLAYNGTSVVSTSTPTAAAYYATSTTATSTFAGPVRISPSGLVTTPLFFVGTSTTGVPLYGSVQGDVIDGEMDFNGTAAVNIANANSGSCASSGFFGDGNIVALSSDYSFFGFTNAGWTGSGCAVGNGAERPESTLISNPTGDMNFELASTSAVAFNWYAGVSKIMQLKNSGRLTLGTTTSAFGLQTNGTSTSAQLVLSDNSGANNLWAFRTIGTMLYISTSTATATSTNPALSIDGSGSAALLIATSSNAAATLAVQGRVFLAGLSSDSADADVLCLTSGNEVVIRATTACITSSLRFKEHVQPLTGALTEVLQMKPVSFDYKKGFGPQNEVGFIAEDVQKIDPRIVDLGADGKPFSVRYMNYTAVLTKAIQEQQQKIDALMPGTAARSLEENWQWLAIGLLGLILIWQHVQLRQLRKKYV